MQRSRSASSAARGAGRSIRRAQPFVSGLLALALVSALTAVAVGGRPRAVDAESGNLATAAFAPATSLAYLAVTLDPKSPQLTTGEALLRTAGFSDVADQLRDSLRQTARTSLNFDSGVAPFLGHEGAVIVTNLGAAMNARVVQSAGVRFAASPAVGSPATPGATPAAARGTPAAAPPPPLAKPAGVAVVVQTSDPELAWLQVQKSMTGRGSGSTNVYDVVYEGVTIRWVPSAPVGPTGGTAAARVGDFILISSTPADLEPLLDAKSGRTDALPSLDAFKRIRGEMKHDFLVEAYVNGPAVREALETSLDARQRASLRAYESYLGSIDAFQGASLWVDAKGLRLDTATVPATTGTSPRVRNFKPKLDEQVPSQTLLFVDGSDLGGIRLWDVVGLLVIQSIKGEEVGAPPPRGLPLDTYLDREFDDVAQRYLGFNIRTDFIRQLVGEFGLAVWIDPLLDPSQSGALFVSGVDDAARVTDAVSKVSLLTLLGGRGSLRVTTKEIEGAIVNVVRGKAQGVPVQVEWGVVKDQLIIGYGTALEDYLHGTSSSLATNPRYKAVMAALPADHHGILYVDLGQVIALAQNAAASSGTRVPPTLQRDYSAIQALAVVTYEKDGLSGTSTILYIAKP